MTRMIRGSVLLAACVGLWSCSSDPTADEAGVPYKIVSSPSLVFIKQDSSQLVSFQLVDELDGQIPETWTFTSTSPNFTVAMDSTYRPVYNSDGTLSLPEEQTEVRVTLTGTALGISNFTASAGGKTLVIPVNVVPGVLNATFAPANPAPGEVVTITLPPTLRLTPSSAITFPGNLNPVSLTIAADSQSATFISAPTTDTTAVVTGVYNTEFPTIAPVTLTTSAKVTGTKSGEWTGELPGAFSATTTGVAPITFTLTPTFAFRLAADTTFSKFTFPTQGTPAVTVSADSGAVTLIVPPNTSSPLRASRVRFRGAPQFEYTLASGTDSVKSTIVIPALPVTLSPLNPAVGDTVTITLGAGFSFQTRVSTVNWPKPGAPLETNAALVGGNSTTAVWVLPLPGTAGVPNLINNIQYDATPGTRISLPASAPSGITMSNTSIYGGRGNPATATLLTTPPLLTDTLEFYDLVEDVDQFYGLTFPANQTLVFQIDWASTADVDMLWCTSDVDPVTPGNQPGGPGCSFFFGGFAGATGAHPENGTVAFVPGQFKLYMNLYAGPTPAWAKIRIRRTL